MNYSKGDIVYWSHYYSMRPLSLGHVIYADDFLIEVQWLFKDQHITYSLLSPATQEQYYTPDCVHIYLPEQYKELYELL